MPLKIFRAQIQPMQLVQVFRPQAGKLVQQLPQRLALTLPCLCEAIKWFKGSSFSEFQDHSRPRHPIRAFAVNEMADHIEGAEGVFTLIA